MLDVELEKAQIVEMNRRVEAAEIAHDVDALLRELTEDALMLGRGGFELQGYDAWRAFYPRFFENLVGGNLTSQSIEVASSGDLAWDHGVFVSEYARPEGPVTVEGKYLSVLRKVGGQWKTAAVCTSTAE